MTLKALEAIAFEVQKQPNRRRIPDLPIPALPEKILNPREAFFYGRRHRRTVKVTESIGCIAAETITVYPPGSAIIVAGERITTEIIEYLRAVHHYGGVLKGASDHNFETITVIEDPLTSGRKQDIRPDHKPFAKGGA